jgi:hypothetical protein
MTQAKKFQATLTSERMVRVPDDVPLGPVLVTVEPAEPEAPAPFKPQFEGDKRPGEGMWRGVFEVPEDFDAPLPRDILRYFEPDGDPEDTET